MQINELITRIAAKTGVDSAQAEKAVGVVLSVLQQEVDPAVSASMFDKLPGAAQLAAANAVNQGSGSMIENLTSGLFGNRVGAVMAGVSRLHDLGLSVAQIESAMSAVLAYIRVNGGAGLAGQVAKAVPTLFQQAA